MSISHADVATPKSGEGERVGEAAEAILRCCSVATKIGSLNGDSIPPQFDSTCRIGEAARGGPVVRDRDVRDALWLRLEAEHAGDTDTLMLDELSLCHGSTRVDLAVINGEIQGYEVKSAKDTLDRLGSQAAIYNATLDRVTIVSADNHLEKVVNFVPAWWGISVARQDGSSLRIEEIRRPQLNPEPDALSIATMLWRDEALAELERRNSARGVRGKSREAVYERLITAMELDELKLLVRRTLKDRCNWRADRRQTRCGG